LLNNNYSHYNKKIKKSRLKSRFFYLTTFGLAKAFFVIIHLIVLKKTINQRTVANNQIKIIKGHNQVQLRSIARNFKPIQNAATGKTSAHQPKVYGIDFLIK
jgi:hypothetical protein